MAFPCYYCRKPTHVLDTQAHIRTRGCKYCGKTFMTREMVDLAQHVGNDKPDKEMQAAADKKYEKELAAEWKEKEWLEREREVYQRHVADGGIPEDPERPHPAAGKGVLSFREFVGYRMGKYTTPKRFLDNPDLIPEE